MPAELPARAFFRYSVPIGRKPERLRVDGNLSEWPSGTLLPDLGELDGRRGFAEVRLTWDEQGLYVGLRVTNKRNVVSHRQRPRAADALFLWVATRDVRDVHRASRFCHQFVALPRGGGTDRQKATAWQSPIHRAREQAPQCEPGRLKVASAVEADSYGLELILPASVLNGFEPDECPRLGLTYLVCDHEHGWQSWTSPHHLPFDWDPSTWGTVELATGG